jgi:uncharacterized protein YaiE (UPF0345 family)
MSEDKFENVTVIKKANVYFDGKVSSRNVLFADGTRKTLGFMLPGEYEFKTASREVMEILNGGMDVLLPGNAAWQSFKIGESFEVPANSSFKLKLRVPVDYCCSYG